MVETFRDTRPIFSPPGSRTTDSTPRSKRIFTGSSRRRSTTSISTRRLRRPAFCSKAGKSCVVLIIEDDGKGFDPKAKKQVSKSGAGSGWSASASGRRSVGGTVEIESTPGNGTTVYVRVPFHTGGGGKWIIKPVYCWPKTTRPCARA